MRDDAPTGLAFARTGVLYPLPSCATSSSTASRWSACWSSCRRTFLRSRFCWCA